MKKTILVTGGAGFIGSFLVDKQIEKGNQVIIYDSIVDQVHHGKIPYYLNKDASFVRADMRDYDALKKAVMEADVVVNFAARVGVGQSMYEVKEYCDTNQQGTANLMNVLANEEHHVKKVVVASSMSIYGEGSYRCERCSHEYHNVKNRTKEQLEKKEWEYRCPECGSVLMPIPTKETKDLDCNSVYAITKKNQEEITLNVGRAYGIPSVALRFFNTHGPRQSLSNPYSGVAAMFMSRIKNNNPPMIFEDGKQKRNFVSIHDIIQGCMLAIESKAADYDTFNVGSEDVVTVSEVAEALMEIYNSKLKLQITGQFRVGDIRHCYPDISKIKSRLDFNPRIKFKAGMKELVEWSSGQESKDMMDKFMSELKNKKLI